MSDYRVIRKSDQRALAQDIAAELNGGRTVERHAEVAAAVLTSDWLAEHDAKVKAEAWDEGASAAHDRLYARVSNEGLIDQHELIKFPVNPYRRTEWVEAVRVGASRRNGAPST